MPPRTKKPKTQTLYNVVSNRDGEKVCGPFDRSTATTERDRLNDEQRQRRAADPIHPTRRGGLVAEPPIVEVARELAAELSRPDLVEKLQAAGGVDLAQATPNDPAKPTTYRLEPVELPAGFDPFSEEPHPEQIARLATEEA